MSVLGSEERWDRRFLELAKMFGTWSKDRSAGTGCVIVGSDRLLRVTGYNGFVRGIDDEVSKRHERPEKYLWTEHAERNAIYNAAKLAGIGIDDVLNPPLADEGVTIFTQPSIHKDAMDIL